MGLIKQLRNTFIPVSDSEPERTEADVQAQGEESKPAKPAERAPGNAEKRNRFSSLTKRERDTCLLLLDGYTMKQSAEMLGIKYSTVNTHMTELYKKLGVGSRAELIIRYRELAAKSRAK